MVKVITLAMLIKKKACEGQVNLFQEYFGESVEITEELCFKYYDKFDIDCLIHNMLNKEQKEAYKAIQGPAYKDYEAITGPAWEAYLAIQGPAWEDYKAIEGPAWKAYEAIEGSAYKDYKVIQGSAYKAYLAIQAPAYEAYKKEQARAFCVAYNS